MSDKDLEKLATEFAKATDDVKEVAVELQGRMEKGESNIQGIAEKADDALTKFNELKASFDELEQKAARTGEQQADDVKSIGEHLVGSDLYERIKSSSAAGRMMLDVKASITSSTADAAGSAGALVQPDFVGLVPPLQQRLTVRDLLMAGRTDSNAIEYVQETGFTNNAASVAEGELKPQSDLKYGSKTASVRTIAHHMSASKQILSDASGLQSMIDGRLHYGLKLAEETQLLNGDGTGENLHGVIPQATAFADPASLAKYTIIDQIRLAQLQAALAELPASGLVLNPIDWATIELEKDGQGRNIIGIPQGTANRTLWGLPVVETPTMTKGKFLTGAFSMGAQIFDAWDMSVGVSFEHKDNFTRNMATILCEERLALAVYRPEAFIYGTLAAKTS